MDEKKMIDPMAFDSEEGLAEKKELWNDIFQRCPDFADLIISIFDDNDGEGQIARIADLVRKQYIQDLKYGASKIEMNSLYGAIGTK